MYYYIKVNLLIYCRKIVSIENYLPRYNVMFKSPHLKQHKTSHYHTRVYVHIYREGTNTGSNCYFLHIIICYKQKYTSYSKVCVNNCL